MQIDRERALGLARGAIGGLVGTLAMAGFFRAVSALTSDGDEAGGDEAGGSEDGGGNGRAPGGAGQGPIESIDALDDISVAGIRSREGEPAPATLGRLAHEAVTGEEPGEDRTATLGQAVHWGYGVVVGGLYGVTRTDAGLPDLAGGLGYGVALWVLGDEVMVPLLGLSEGPTAHDWTIHARGLGAHVVYGLATAATTQALRHVM